MEMNQEDGWYFADKDKVSFHFIQNHPVPRPFGFIDQLKNDIKAPVAVVMWIATIASFAIGILQPNIFLLVSPMLAFYLFGTTFYRLIRIMRHGEVSVVRMDETVRTFGEIVLLAGNFRVGDVVKRIQVQTRMSELLTRTMNDSGAVDVLVLLDMKYIDSKKTNCVGMAIRGPSGLADAPTILPKVQVRKM